MSALTHFNADGQAHMVDVGDKADTHRRAIASGVIRMQPDTFALVQSGSHKKGDVLGIARVAAIMASKHTSTLIPLCHPLALSHVDVEFQLDAAASAITCRVTAETVGKTGVEMEALTAVQIGLLTIYDMCKAVDRGMVIGEVRLLEKQGGKSGLWRGLKPLQENSKETNNFGIKPKLYAPPLLMNITMLPKPEETNSN